MNDLIFTPLGAGNYQYVVRITTCIDSKISDIDIDNKIYKNSNHSSSNISKYSRNTDENGISGRIPRYSVLKILKYENVKDYASRIKFHYQFNSFLNHFNTFSAQKTTKMGQIDDGLAPNGDNIYKNSLISGVSNIANNVPNKIMCIIERNVASKIRKIFNNLLIPNMKCINNYTNGSNNGNIFNVNDNVKNCMKKNDVKIINKSKIMIFYDKMLENNYSINVDCTLIKPLEVNELMVHDKLNLNEDLRVDNSMFDSNKYELCSIEEDLFNINNFINNKNSLCNNSECYNENIGCHRSNGVDGCDEFDTNICNKHGLKNISIEIKLKCVLKNFKNYPSLFKMNQINKKNVNYIISNGLLICNGIHESYYEPCNFSELNYESLKQELINLIQIPQNNLRIFVDNYQIAPKTLLKNKVKTKLYNGVSEKKISEKSDTSRGDNDVSDEDGDNELIELIVRSILDNKERLKLLFKLQSLASGQQFVSSVLYSIYNLFLKFYCITSKTSTLNMSCESNHNLMKIAKRDEKTVNRSVNDDNIELKIKRMKLYDKFKSNESNHYEIQRSFYQSGIKLAHLMYIRLINILNSMKNCNFYTNNANLSRDRMNNRFNGSNYMLFKLLNEIVSCLLSFICNVGGSTETNENVLNFLLKNSKRDDNTKNDGIDLCILQDGVVKTIIKTVHHRNKSNASRNLHYANICVPRKNELRIIKEWIYLYLYGRVAMDLSIIINIIYTDDNSKAGCKKILYNKLSFVDLDLKSINNIYKYKTNKTA